MLEVGMKAPLFTLPDKNGEMVSLSHFLGKKVVFYKEEREVRFRNPLSKSTSYAGGK